MTRHYVEMKDELTEEETSIVPEQLVRIYVDSEAEAELIYADYKAKFDILKLKGTYVEMNHDIDPVKNKPCVSHDIIDGKVEINGYNKCR